MQVKPNKAGLDFIKNMLDTAIRSLENKEKAKNANKLPENILKKKYDTKIEKHISALKKINHELQAEVAQHQGQLSSFLSFPYVQVNRNYSSKPLLPESKELAKAKKDRDDLLMRLAMGQDVAAEVRALITSIEAIK